MAWLQPAIPLDVVDTQRVRRLLGPAAEAARLRAALRVRADEIERSRQRLETTADDERSRLVALLQSGPLASLAQASELLVSTPSGRALAPRAAAADRVLRDVVRGLDPAAASGGLLPALEKLAAGAGARWSFASSVDLGPAESRALWFTCAEGLANATKHAPGASMEVRLERVGPTYVLSVCDDGCGGADTAGPGLCGLRERAVAVGATLYVDSPVGGGTSLRLVLPERADQPRWHVDDAASTPIIGEPISGTVDA
jgi:signal transduction histidine kinase